MKIGFTGTQKGMTARQRQALSKLLWQLFWVVQLELHHGDCIGADEEAHEIARQYRMTVALHPPQHLEKRAYCKGAKIQFPAKPYLERNRTIVEMCYLLIAAPRSLQEELRSGTWATVRYARHMNRPVVILDP